MTRDEAGELVHGTCVALGKRAALLRGPSGAGKSDLALRFLALPGDGEYLPLLVADDQVFVAPNGNDELIASSPQTIAGKIEVRGRDHRGAVAGAGRFDARLRSRRRGRCPPLAA